MTNRRFNFDKFRVFIRLTVKSTAGHSRITWSEWQTYKGRITRSFGEYTWRQANKSVNKAMFIEQEAPK